MSHDLIIHALRIRRQEAGFSREKIANIAGMSKRTYDRIERGESDIKISQYCAIVRELGLSNLDLFLDILNIEKPSAEDMTAVSRLLSADARRLLIQLIIAIDRDN